MINRAKDRMDAHPELGQDAATLRVRLPAGSLPLHHQGVMPNTLPAIAECWKCHRYNVLEPSQLRVAEDLMDVLRYFGKLPPSAGGTDDQKMTRYAVEFPEI